MEALTILTASPRALNKRGANNEKNKIDLEKKKKKKVLIYLAYLDRGAQHLFHVLYQPCWRKDLLKLPRKVDDW